MCNTASTVFFLEGGLCYLIIVDPAIFIFDICGFDYSQRPPKDLRAAITCYFADACCELEIYRSQSLA